jgi:hypothetical protein
VQDRRAGSDGFGFYKIEIVLKAGAVEKNIMADKGLISTEQAGGALIGAGTLLFIGGFASQDIGWAMPVGGTIGVMGASLAISGMH